jgi:pimeloyl-ACP methyl ester carboxylesterase
MQIAANGMQIEVEDHGPTSGEPLVLIMGLGMQLLGWHEDFVDRLVGRGFRVIRFDNRDIGLSQQLDHLGVPNVAAMTFKSMLGLPVGSPYGLPDMAADTVGILDALGIQKAHVCGASMGGMIAQQLAVRHPTRAKSLTLMMTTSGARRLPGPKLRLRNAIMSRPPSMAEFDSVVDHYVRLYRMIGSPGFQTADDYLRQRLTTSVRRSYRPRGVARQLAAIIADGDRSVLLPRIQVPTTVLHGREDPLVPVAAGHDLAARIPGATLEVIEGWGHDLPPPLWPRLVQSIESVASRA